MNATLSIITTLIIYGLFYTIVRYTNVVDHGLKSSRKYMYTSLIR